MGYNEEKDAEYDRIHLGEMAVIQDLLTGNPEGNTKMPTIWETNRTLPEAHFLLNNRVGIFVAKVGGGTIFRKYAGDWLFDVTAGDMDETVLENTFHSPHELTHYEAAKQIAAFVAAVPERSVANALSTQQEDTLSDFANGHHNWSVRVPDYE